MAKITITGQAIVLTSSLKLDDIKTVEKYRPKELTVFGGEDGKEPIFKIATGKTGSVNKYGVTFAEATRGDEKLATLTTLMDCPTDDVKEFIADAYGAVIVNLNKLEEKLPTVLAEIDSDKANVLEHIDIVQ